MEMRAAADLAASTARRMPSSSTSQPPSRTPAVSDIMTYECAAESKRNLRRKVGGAIIARRCVNEKMGKQ
jgi:hypothetical protein